MINGGESPYVGEEVIITWTEQGGPPVVAPEAAEGFGSRMLKRGMSSRLFGSVAFNRAKEGVIVTLRMNKNSLTA